MPRLLLAVVILLLTSVPILPAAYGQGEGGISVSRNLSVQETQPGSQIDVTLVLTVTDMVNAVILGETFPSGFRLLSSEPETSKSDNVTNTAKWLFFSREGVGNETVRYTLQIPETTPDGDYVVRGNWSATSPAGRTSGSLEPSLIRVATPLVEKPFLTIITPFPDSSIVKVNGSYVKADSSGRITLGPGQARYLLEIDRTVSESEASRRLFSGWTDGTKEPTLLVNLQGNTTIGADFNSEYFVSAESPYGQTTGSGWYLEGKTAEVTVTEEVDLENLTRRVFDTWKGDATSKEASLKITVDGPKKIMAEWRTQYFVTATSDYGNVTGGGWHYAGSLVKIGVSPFVDHGNSTRHGFVRWTGDRSGESPEIEIEVDSPLSIRVDWVTLYLLTVQSDYGRTSGSGLHVKGSQVQFGVSPTSISTGTFTSQVFDGWAGDYQGREPTGTILMDSPKSITANWREESSQTFLLLGGAVGVVVVVAAALLVLRRVRRR